MLLMWSRLDRTARREVVEQEVEVEHATPYHNTGTLDTEINVAIQEIADAT